MKKLALVIAFIGIGYLGVNAQNAPKKEVKPAPAATAVADVPADVKPTEAAASSDSNKKSSCSAEEKKSCGSSTGKKSCCSKKAEAKKETTVNP